MVAMLQEEREAAGRSDHSMAIGHITPFLYVGSPSWDVGDGTVSGSPQSIAERVLARTAVGVNQLQVRFKARSCDELCEQLQMFGTDVAPLLTTVGS
jgi:hypothetical protein